LKINLHCVMGKKKSVLNKIKAASKTPGKAAEHSSKLLPPLPELPWPWRPTRPAGGAKARAPTGRMGSAMVPAVPGSGCDGFVVGGYNGSLRFHLEMLAFLASLDAPSI